MFDTLVQNLIESFADVIAGTAVAIANDHQVRRDKLDEYKSAAHANAQELLNRNVGAVGMAVRNRYAEWIEHPRLGHESLTAELQAADVAMNEAVIALKKSATILNRLLLTVACIRLTAITEVLGPECIYLGSIKRATPVKAARRQKAAKADGDKRLSRRAIQIDDVPVEIRPAVADLISSNPSRAHTLAELETGRGGDQDQNGIITKLTTLAALDEHQAFIDELAVAAGATVPAARPMLPPSDQKLVADGPAIVDEVAEMTTPSRPMSLPGGAISEEARADITLVAGWCAGKTWALLECNNVITLKKLAKRRDVNEAFDRVATHPAMQEALRAIRAAGLPRGP